MLFILFLFLGNAAMSQNIEGAWKLTLQNGKAVNNRVYIKIIQDGYFAFAASTSDSGHFVSAGGGNYQMQGGTYTETLDFYTNRPEAIGKPTEYVCTVVGATMTISASMHGIQLEEVWQRISNTQDELTGNWVITGRKRDSTLTRTVPGARRTIKILSGGHFQWVAFNSDTREFMGTGGGTYTAQNGHYVERIAFFSRDNKRVGATLPFQFRIIDGEWHHAGLSSSGSNIYEIWSKYSLAYKPAQ